MPIDALDPKLIKCFLSSVNYPGEKALVDVWNTTFAFASRKQWVLSGGWAQHIFLSSHAPQLALYDESRACTSGDFDVLCTDPLGDLVELAQILHKQTGMQVTVGGGMRPNIFHANFNFGGVGLVDCSYIPPDVIDFIPHRVFESPHGVLRIADPVFELGKIYHLVSNVFLLGNEANLDKRFKRMHMLEDALLSGKNANVNSNSNANSSANSNSNGAANANKTSAATRYLQDVVAKQIGLRGAVLVGQAAYRALRGWDALKATGTVLELAVHDLLFAEVANSLIAGAVQAFPSAVSVSVHTAFIMLGGPPYSCWIDINVDALPLVRLLCLPTPVPCAHAQQPGVLVASCFFQLAHLMWAEMLESARGDGAAARRHRAAFAHTQRMYLAASAEGAAAPIPELLDYVVDERHFAGRMPAESLYSRYNKRRATGSLANIRINSTGNEKPSIAPDALSALRKSSYHTFDGRRVATADARQLLADRGAIIRLLAQHLPETSFSLTTKSNAAKKK